MTRDEALALFEAWLEGHDSAVVHVKEVLDSLEKSP